MIYGLLLALHLIICVTLILVVLLQSGKGGGLAGAFGGMGGAGQTLFGGRGAATFLSKATSVLGVAFMTTSLVLALLSGTHNAPKSVLREGQINTGAAPPPAGEQAPMQLPGQGGGGSSAQPAPGGQSAPPSQAPGGLSLPSVPQGGNGGQSPQPAPAQGQGQQQKPAPGGGQR